MAAIDRLMEDAVDIHVHFAPDPKVERRCDAIGVAESAKSMGMRGVVLLKSHEYPTHPVAYTVSKMVPGISLIGGITLDVEVGGLNPMAVEASANMGARVVWMPTFSARVDRQRQGLDGGIYLLDDGGRLLPEVYPILEIIKQHDMVLATGHISTQESMVLVDEARNLGIHRIVVTHGSTMSFWTGMTVEDMKALADKGAFIEHCIHIMMPLTFRLSPAELGDMLQAIGPEHCIISTDFGQAYHPIPPEGLRMGIATLLQAGTGGGRGWHDGEGQSLASTGAVTGTIISTQGPSTSGYRRHHGINVSTDGHDGRRDGQDGLAREGRDPRSGATGHAGPAIVRRDEDGRMEPRVLPVRVAGRGDDPGCRRTV